MADSCRRAADGVSLPVNFGRLAACLAASCLLHVAALLVDWSSLGPFRLLGSAARSQKWQDSRPIDAVIVAATRPPAAGAPVGQRAAAPRPAPPASKPAPVRAPQVRAVAPEPEPLPAPVVEEPLAEPPAAEGEAARALPVPNYFPAEALTRQPELIGGIDESLREPVEAGLRGRAIIRLYLNQSGKPERVSVLESTLPVEIEGLVVKAFYTAQYRPGEIDGLAVMSEMTVDVDLSSTTEIHVPNPLPAAPAGGGAAPANRP